MGSIIKRPIKEIRKTNEQPNYTELKSMNSNELQQYQTLGIVQEDVA
jgi:hypothetical protein